MLITILMAMHHYFWIPAAPGSTRDPHLRGISDPPQAAVTQWGGVMVTFTCESMEFSSKKHVDFTQTKGIGMIEQPGNHGVSPTTK